MRFMSILLLQALHSFLKIYLNVITTLHIFSDGHIYVKVLEYFSLMLTNFNVLTLLILSDVQYFGVNEA